MVKESKGNAMIRGIAPTMPEQQTFEIYMPKKMIDDYKKNYLNKVITEIERARSSIMTNYNELQKTLGNFPAIPYNLDLRSLEKTNEVTNKIIKKYIEQVKSEPNFYIRERSLVERLFGLFPKDKRIPLMFHDHFLPSFYKTLLCGLDFDFMILEVLVIACMDRSAYLENKIESGLVFGVLIAYIVDYLLIWLKRWRSRKNIAMHTLCDEMFLF
jgi:hypothetical protein